MLTRFLVWWISLWPERWALAWGEALGTLARLLGVRTQVAAANLLQAFPELQPEAREELARKHYRHLGRSAVEFFRAAALTDEQLFARVDTVGWPLVDQAAAGEKGCVVAVCHLGNFELLAAYAARRGYALTAVTRPLKGAFNRAWMGVRTLMGVRELQGRNVVGQMLQVLRENGFLAVIIDQNMLPKRAIFVPLFGRLAATTPAPGVLAARSGAPVILSAMLRNPDGRFEIRVLGPFGIEPGEADGAALTARLNAALEGLIRDRPEQWFWVHRRWKTRPPDEVATPGPAPF